jgi:hypothetical protein
MFNSMGGGWYDETICWGLSFQLHLCHHQVCSGTHTRFH